MGSYVSLVSGLLCICVGPIASDHFIASFFARWRMSIGCHFRPLKSKSFFAFQRLHNNQHRVERLICEVEKFAFVMRVLIFSSKLSDSRVLERIIVIYVP